MFLWRSVSPKSCGTSGSFYRSYPRGAWKVKATPLLIILKIRNDIFVLAENGLDRLRLAVAEMQADDFWGVSKQQAAVAKI